MSLPNVIHSGKPLSIVVLSGILLPLVIACGITADSPASHHGDATPRYIVYYNSNSTPLLEVARADYSHVILSFIQVLVEENGSLRIVPPPHMNRQWDSVHRVQTSGKRVLISYGGGLAGSDEYTALIGREAEVASLLAGWVKERGLDGVDIDFEASAMFHTRRSPGVGDGRKFLTRLTDALREHLPAPRYLLTHAPEPPYLNPGWHGGPYLDILSEVGGNVDWIIVQYYNNGPAYDDPDSDDNIAGHTGYVGLTSADHHLRWPATKVVIGKPIYHADARSGHLSPEGMSERIVGPMLQRYGSDFGGVAGWQYSDLTPDHRAWNSQIGHALIESREGLHSLPE